MQDPDKLRALQKQLEDAYLASDNPRGQSGFGHDDDAWQRAREVIVEPVDRNGTFLDIGCANGYLLESLVTWSAERGYAIEPYGLDISEKLVELARIRLPEWSDRFFVGDALTWTPPMQFDYVRTELVYVLDQQREQYVEQLLTRVVAPGGRLIVCSYGSARRPDIRAERVGERLEAWGHATLGEAEVRHANGAAMTLVAWIDRH